MKINLNNIRREYRKSGLNENGLPDNPLELVEQWLEEAIKVQVNEPTAMLVGTVSEAGPTGSTTGYCTPCRPMMAIGGGSGWCPGSPQRVL